jgi:hypothetical protein
MLATCYMRQQPGGSERHHAEKCQPTPTERHEPATALDEEAALGFDCNAFVQVEQLATMLQIFSSHPGQ